MKIFVGLHAVDSVDFGAVVTGKLISTSRSDFEDGTVGFSDEGGDDSILLVGVDSVIWSLAVSFEGRRRMGKESSYSG